MLALIAFKMSLVWVEVQIFFKKLKYLDNKDVTFQLLHYSNFRVKSSEEALIWLERIQNTAGES